MDESDDETRKSLESEKSEILSYVQNINEADALASHLRQHYKEDINFRGVPENTAVVILGFQELDPLDLIPRFWIHNVGGIWQ